MATDNLILDLGVTGIGAINDASKAILGLSAAAAEAGGKGMSTLVSGAAGAAKSLAELGMKGAEVATKFALGFGKESVSAFKEFEKEISAAGAVSGLAGNDLLEFKKKASDVALQLGKDLPVSASQAAKAITELTKAGLNSDAALGAAGQTALLAAAGNLEMGQAATIAANTMSQFGMDTTTYDAAMKSATRATDELAKIANASAVDVTDLAKTFEYAGPVAAGAGFAFEDVAQAAGALGNAGIKGSAAGTGLNMVMSTLAAPTGKAAEALRKLGHSTKDSAGNIIPLGIQLNDLRDKFKNLSDADKIDFAKQIVGVNHFPKFLALMTQSQEKWDDMAKAAHNSEGAAKDMAAAMTDNLYGAFENLSGTVETFKIKVGQALEPAVKIAAQGLNKLVVAAFPLADILGKAVTTGVEKVSHGLVQLGSAFGILVSTFKGGKAFVETSSEFSLVERVAGKVGLAFHDLSKSVSSAIKEAQPLLLAFKLGLSGDWKPDGIHSIGAAFATIGNVVSQVWPTVRDAITGLKLGFSGKWIPEEVQTMPAFFATLGDKIHTSLVVAQQAISNFFKGLSGGSAAIETSSEFGAIVIAAGKLGAVITEKVIPTVQTLWQEFKPVIQTAFELYSALSPISTIFDVIVGTLNGGFNGAWAALTEHVAKAGDVFGVNLRPAMESVGNFISGTLFPTLTNIANVIVGQVIPQVLSFAQTAGQVLLPILQGAGNFIMGTLIPTVTQIASSIATNVLPQVMTFAQIVATNLQPVLEGLGTFIGNVVLPVFANIGQFIATQVIPFIGNLGEIINTVAKPAFEGLSGFITSAVLPVLTDIGNFINSNVIPALTSIGQWINSDVMPALRPMAEFLGGFLKSSFEILGQTVGTVWEGVKTAVTGAWEVVSGIFNTIKAVLSGDFDAAWKNMQSSIDGVWKMVQGSVEAGWGIVQGIFNTIIAFLGGVFKGAWDGLQSNVKSVWDGVTGAVSSAWGNIQSVFNNFVSELGKIASAADKSLKGDFVGAWQTLTGESEKAGSNISSSITTAVSTFNNTIAPLPGQTSAKMNEVKAAVTGSNLGAAGQQIGQALGDGMANGMASKMGAVMSAAARLAQSASAAAKANLQVASPSKVFIKIGENTAEGLAIGIQSGSGNAESAVISLTGKITDEALQAAGKQTEIFSKIADTSQKIFQALSTLRDYSSIGYKHINAFATDIHQLVAEFAEVQRHFESGTLETTAKFADSAAKVVDMVGKGISALPGLQNYTSVGYGAINAFATDIHMLVADFVHVQQFFTTDGLKGAGEFSDAANKIVSVIANGAKAFAELQTYKGVPSGNLQAFSADIELTVQLASETAKKMETDMLKQVGAFGEATSKLFSGLKSAMEVFKGLLEFKSTPSEVIQQFVNEVGYTVGLAAGLADQTDKELLTKTSAFGEATGKIFGGLKSAMDTFKSLSDFKGYPAEGMTNLLNGIIDAVGKMADANDVAGQFEQRAQEFFNKIAGAADKLKDAASKAREGAQSVADATGALNGASSNGGGGGDIPSYAAGTKSHPGGLALFGETGPELLRMPSGAFRFAGGPTLADLPQGTEVYSASATQDLMNQRAELPSANLVNFPGGASAGNQASASTGGGQAPVITIQQNFTISGGVDAATIQKLKQAAYEAAQQALKEQGRQVRTNRGLAAAS